MNEVMNPVASAVVIPEHEPSRSPSTKRRRTSSADSNAKRPRVSTEPEVDATPLPAQSPDSNLASRQAGQGLPSERGQDRRKSSVQEERKRGQRLFGGLLSTLSQSTPVGQQKRRLEIEKRQLEKVKQQKTEDEGRRAARLASLQEVRKVEHIKFEEQVMKIRHQNSSCMAHFLLTKAEPKLYYKPWKLLPSDEDRIAKQISETEAMISKEVAAFKKQHPGSNAIDEEDKQRKAGISTSQEKTVGKAHVKSPSASFNNINDDDDTTNPLAQEESKSGHDSGKEVQKHTHEEHSGEVVVENDEDTVIY